MKIVDILVDNLTEDSCLQLAAQQDYDYAIVYRDGHEFQNRDVFVEEMSKNKFFIIGHILDRSHINAYYELHVQCYVIDLAIYKALKCPIIGQQTFHSSHWQILPERSDENYHDDYTPWWVKTGHRTVQYEHKPHGWNILSTAFNNNLPVLVFNNTMRNAKKFNYE